ncbi:recombinase family protein [Deinococcus sp. HSC-46F16]|uniref:recombinase family protein n=1 Tax=Deinococcus sp. HSC-46F16 TaxID=2910968 RepID=UPI003531EE03
MRTAAAHASALRGQGLSLRAVAAQLEACGVQTRQGGPWNAVQVKRVLGRQKLNPPDTIA